MFSKNIEYYFKNIPKRKLLTRDEEVILAQRIEAGDKEARRIMIESNLKLAISIAKKYAKYGSDLEELIQESNIGLMKAIEKFDWRKGYKFSTYATWWIKQAATRKLTSDCNLIQIPSHTIGNARKIMQTYQEYVDEFNEEPTIQELADLLNIKEKHVKEALIATKAKNLVSIDKPSSEDNSRTLGEMLPSNQKSLDSLLIDKEIKEQIIESFKSLSKREEMVIRMRFGIYDVPKNDKDVYEV